MDGIDATKRSAPDAGRWKIPIIAMTADAFDDDAEMHRRRHECPHIQTYRPETSLRHYSSGSEPRQESAEEMITLDGGRLRNVRAANNAGINDRIPRNPSIREDFDTLMKLG